MKNKICFFFLIFGFVATTLMLTLPIATKQANTITTFGKVVISVFSKSDHTPIENATVCVIETNEYFFTSSLGSTQKIQLQASKKSDIYFSLNTWTEYTLLIYKNGFYPHLYYGLKIQPNQTKTGIVITLTERMPHDEFTFTQSYEYPSTSWSENIIDKYKR